MDLWYENSGRVSVLVSVSNSKIPILWQSCSVFRFQDFKMITLFWRYRCDLPYCIGCCRLITDCICDFLNLWKLCLNMIWTCGEMLWHGVQMVLIIDSPSHLWVICECSVSALWRCFGFRGLLWTVSDLLWPCPRLRLQCLGDFQGDFVKARDRMWAM